MMIGGIYMKGRSEFVCLVRGKRQGCAGCAIIIEGD